MRWLPFFGSEDDHVEKIDLRESNTESDNGSDVRIVSNIDDSNINIIGADKTSKADAEGGFTVHTISMADDSGSSVSDDRTEPSRKTSPEPTTPSPPSSGPEPASGPKPSSDPEPASGPEPSSGPEPYSRGTFALPNDRDFMQKLEARGKNGHGEIVETVYVLTGPTYTQPTDLIRLDNEEYYGSATKTSVRFDPQSMARKVASLYPDNEPPKLIARFHTHPNGTLRPSSADKQSAPNIEQSFKSAFGTDDFEFFHGIHGLVEHGRSPEPDERQSPSDSKGYIHWLGERYRHKLVVYGDGFEKQKNVGIH